MKNTTDKNGNIANNIKKLLEHSKRFGLYIYQDEGLIVHANRAFCKMVGYECKQLVGRVRFTDLLELEEKQRKVIYSNIERRLKGKRFPYEYKEIPYKTKNSWLIYTINFAYTVNYKGKPSGLVLVFDITPRKTFINLYKTLSEINQIAVRESKEKKLIKKVCNVLYKQRDFCAVVLGSIDEDTKLFNAKLMFGNEKFRDLFMSLKISVDENIPEGRGTVGRAYRSKSIAVSDNIFADTGMEAWRKAQKVSGVYSACSVPLLKNGKVEYVIIIYSQIANIFSKRYIRLLKEVQDDISFALEKIEKNRELTLLNDAFYNSTNWILIADEDGTILKLNRSVERISGYSADELIGKNPRIFKSGIHSKDFYKELYNHITKGKEYRCTFTNRSKDGSLFYLDSVIVPKRVNGEKLYIDIGRDITEEINLRKKAEKYYTLYKAIYEIDNILTSSKTVSDIINSIPHVITGVLKFSISFVVDFRKGDFEIASYSSKDVMLSSFLKYFKENIDHKPFSDIKDFLANLKGFYYENDILSNKNLKPFHEQVKLFGLNSCFSMPIISKNKKLFTLTAFIKEKGFFDEEIVRLLKRLNEDINETITNIDIKKWNEIFLKSLDSSFDFMVVTDGDFNIVYVNDNVLKYSGYSKEELIGKHHSVFSSRTHSKEFSKMFYDSLKLRGSFTGMMTYRTKDSKLVKAFMNIFRQKDEDGNEYYIAIGRDITKNSEIQKIIDYTVSRDGVTGLILRNEFVKQVDIFLKRAKFEKLIGAVLIINPVKFSFINNVYGFDIGNRVLLEISNRIKSFFREYDIIAKLESGRFAVLAQDLRMEEDIYKITTNLISHLANPYNIDNIVISLPFNVGISLFPKDGNTAQELLRNAEIALYSLRGKENVFGFFKEDYRDKVERLVKLREDIAKAIKNREFVLFYQPYFDAETLSVVGAEALIRWIRNGKFIPPLEFIPYLEETGMIRPIEDWILDTIIEKQKSSKIFKNIPISINVSPVSFGRSSFIYNLASLIKKHNANASLINLEIIERIFIERFEETKRSLELLRGEGFGISIDDFGTGYSSLSYLYQLPVDYLKIDISFIRAMISDSKAASIVKNIIAISKDLKIKTIAEGVEIENQLKILREMGCDYVQGFLLSRPLPEEKFTRFISQTTLPRSHV